MTVYRKYTYSAIATTAMLSSRRSRASAARRDQRARPLLDPGGAAVSGFGSESVAVIAHAGWMTFWSFVEPSKRDGLPR